MILSVKDPPLIPSLLLRGVRKKSRVNCCQNAEGMGWKKSPLTRGMSRLAEPISEVTGG